MNEFGITEKEFSEWLHLPVTEAYIKFIESQIEARREIAGSGGCLGSEGFEVTGQRYFAIMNAISLYDSMLEDIKQFEVILPPIEEENSDDDNSQEGVGRQSVD